MTQSILKTKKTIRVAYTDFWPYFKPEITPFIQIVSTEFNLVEDYENPEVVICSVFGQNYKKYDCPRIMYTGEPVSPDFSSYDYVIGFNHIFYPERYLRMPIFYIHKPELQTNKKTEEKHLWPDEFYKNKTKFCARVVSDSDCATPRDDFFQMLNARKHVDAAGTHLNNMGGYCPPNKIEFLEPYRFNLTFEQEYMDGYTTEKLTDAYAAGAIPIYSGNNRAELDFNPKSYIDVSKFSSFDEAIDYILYVDSHPEEYMKIVREPAWTSEQRQHIEYEQQLLDFFHQILDGPVIKKWRTRERMLERTIYWKQPAPPTKFQRAKRKIRRMMKP